MNKTFNSSPTPLLTHLESKEEEKTKGIFQTLYDFDVSPYVESVQGRDYIEWSTAWRLVKEMYPDTHYSIRLFPGDLPYLKTEVGIWVLGSVRIGNHIETTFGEDWYPVTDSKNPVESITAFDISNAHQRCLVKCLGRLGFGLKLWEKGERDKMNSPSAEKRPSGRERSLLSDTGGSSSGGEFRFSFGKWKDKSFSEVPADQLDNYVSWLIREDAVKNRRIQTAYHLWLQVKDALKLKEPPQFDANPFSDLPFSDLDGKN